MIPLFAVFCLHFDVTTLRTRLFSHLQLRLCIRDVLEGTANDEDENPNPKHNRPPTKKPTKKTKKADKGKKNTKKNSKNRSLLLLDESQEDGEVEEEPNYYYGGKAFDSSRTDSDNDDDIDDDTDDDDDVHNYYYTDQNESQLEAAVFRSRILRNFIGVDKLLELKVFGPGDVPDLDYSEGMVTKVCNV